MNSCPWCPARNLSLRLIYCNRGTALRRSARLPLLGWVSTALHPPPFFSSSRRHRLLLAFCCLLSRFIPYRITGTSPALVSSMESSISTDATLLATPRAGRLPLASSHRWVLRLLLVTEPGNVPTTPPPNDEFSRMTDHTLLARPKILRHHTTHGREGSVASAAVGATPSGSSSAYSLSLQISTVAVGGHQRWKVSEQATAAETLGRCLRRATVFCDRDLARRRWRWEWWERSLRRHDTALDESQVAR